MNRKQFLETVKARYGVPAKYPNAMVLNGVPYVHELLECELFLIEDQLAGLNNDLPQDDSLITTKPPFSAANTLPNLSIGVSLEEAHLAEDIARTLWFKRYLTAPAKKHLGPHLLKELILDVFDRKVSQDITVVSCHDYTILTILGSIQYPEYPDHVLSFSSYLLAAFYEADEDFPSENYALLFVNSRPFLRETDQDILPSDSLVAENEKPLICPSNGTVFWPLSHFQSSFEIYQSL